MKKLVKENLNEELKEYKNLIDINIGKLNFTYNKDKNRLEYSYPGKGFASTVEGILSNEDCNNLIELLNIYKNRQQ